ncbi:MAG: acetolactate synthase-1/2/3 large subunit [Hyphomicrobiaceae bacterium]|jgi:acetolactate synthase-1/2/3 large subunit
MSASNSTAAMSGAAHLVDALKADGVSTIFSLSGNQIMPVYDALIGSGIRLIHTRHEGGAVYMSEAYAQLTGKVGIALLTAGPGFANGLSAMYSARESQTPLVVMTGDAPLKLAGRGAFQEMDQQTAATALAKASFSVDRPGDMFDAIQNAIALAKDGTPGPVHISLHDDVLRDVADRQSSAPAVPSPAELSSTQQAALTLAPEIAAQIKAAKRPLFLAGPSFARTAWEAKFKTFADETGIPMLALESPRGLRAPRIGALAQTMSEADLVVLLSIGPNFMLGFGQTPAFAETTKFICCHDNTEILREATNRLGTDKVTTVPMSGTAALASLGSDGPLNGLSPNATEADWRARVEEAISWRPSAWCEEPAAAPPFHAASVAYEVGKFLDKNPGTSLTIDGGEVGQWCQAILDTSASVINGPSGAIGGSIPYSIAAKSARPDQPSIAMLGDGTAGFYFVEFETALREDLPMVAIVGNDAKWNAEHQIQVRDYGENRAYACEMVPTRYDEMAKAMGCYGENVTNINELVPAIERAIASGKPACINVEIQSIAAPAITR